MTENFQTVLRQTNDDKSLENTFNYSRTPKFSSIENNSELNSITSFVRLWVTKWDKTVYFKWEAFESGRQNALLHYPLRKLRIRFWITKQEAALEKTNNRHRHYQRFFHQILIKRKWRRKNWTNMNSMSENNVAEKVIIDEANIILKFADAAFYSLVLHRRLKAVHWP